MLSPSAKKIKESMTPEMRAKLAAEKERRERVKKNASEGKYAQFKARYWDRPDLFVKECFNWPVNGIPGPTEYQLEILRAIWTERRVAFRGPHGLGKTATFAWLVLWFSLTRDGKTWKIITTAGAWRQLNIYLWPEIHIWANVINWDVVGRPPFNELTELMHQKLRLSTGTADAVTSNKSTRIEGAHAPHIMYLFDEAKDIPASLYDSASGALSSGNRDGKEAFAVAGSTPGDTQGRFYLISKRDPRFGVWWTKHVTWQETVDAGLNDPDFYSEAATMWGPESALFHNKVLGEFKSSEEDGVIPLAWVELANQRWIEIVEKVIKKYRLFSTKAETHKEEELELWAKACDIIERGKIFPFYGTGVDVAEGGGNDETVIAPRYGNMITRFRKSKAWNPMDAANQAFVVHRRFPAEGEEIRFKGISIVDANGAGSGTYRRLKELGVRCFPFVASKRGLGRDLSGQLSFHNMRSQALWNLRELLDPNNGYDIALPPDDIMTGDLTMPHYRTLAGGKIMVESKAEIKRRLGMNLDDDPRSTDRGDGVAQAFFNLPRRAMEMAQSDYTGNQDFSEAVPVAGEGRWNMSAVQTNGVEEYDRPPRRSYALEELSRPLPRDPFSRIRDVEF